MSDPKDTPLTVSPSEGGSPEAAPAEEANFAQLLEQYESEAAKEPKVGDRVNAKVVNITDESVLVDIGAKSEGVLRIEQVRSKNGDIEVQPGDEFQVIIEGVDQEGNFKLARLSPDRPRNLEDLKVAYEQGLIIYVKVTGVVKGGLAVDAGERGFLPQSRSGVRDASEMHKLVGQEVRARIAKAPEKKNVIVDRRSVLEAEEKEAEKAALERLHDGDETEGTVKSLATYGAFVDLGGIDGLLHVSDISWTHIPEPARLLHIGDKIRVKVLKIDRNKRRISVGMKQLSPDPWLSIPERFHVGDRVRGTVQRTTEFGAFVELEPGVEGLVHVSEMSWSRKVRKPSDVVKPGDTVEVVVLGVSPGERRLSLGLKQALGDPWEDAETRFAPGTIVEGRVRNIQPFGAFVELAEGVDGMIHIGDLSENRLNSPNEVVQVGDTVKAKVLEVDREKRRIRLGVRQLKPTPLEAFLAEHKVGDEITGRVIKAYPGRVELDEGVEAACPSAAPPVKRIEEGTLAAKLAAVWKPQQPAAPVPDENAGKVQLKSGEVRRFRIIKLEAEKRGVEVEPA